MIRTVTLTFSLLFITAFSFAQTYNWFPQSEDFELEINCQAICNSNCQLTQSWKNASQVGVTGTNASWVVDNGGTSSSSTGPDVDHTNGNFTGKYVYLESSSPCFPQAVAMLVSPWCDFSNVLNPELSFWYHMLGQTMGTMHIDVQVGASGNWTLDVVPPWTADTNLWMPKIAVLNGQSYTDSVRMRIRGVTGTGFTSDMAVDDIQLGGFQSCDLRTVSSNITPGSYALTDTQSISITVQNYSTDTLFAGDSIPVCFQVVNQPVVCEQIVLTQPLYIGDSISYTFTTRGDLADFQFVFNTWVDWPCDSFPGNDTLTAAVSANYPPEFSCVYMWVDVLMPWRLRPCRSSKVIVYYENLGIDTAFNAFVKVGLDTSLVTFDALETSNFGGVQPDSIVGDTLCFNLGTVLPRVQQQFNFWVRTQCDTSVIGQTACVGAHIYPDTFCIAPNQSWDRSSVSVWGNCLNDSLVCFTVTNTGSPTNGNMAGPTPWRLYVNNVLVSSGQLQLCGGCDTALCWPGLGNTLRLEVDQRPGHPGNSNPNAAIESCGNPNQITGLVNQLPLDDGDHFREIFCREITAAVDPNEKSVSPSGTGIDHIVAPNSRLEYTIDFQNTGNDTAFLVVIKDTLPSTIDTSSILFGAMSHNGVAVQNGYELTWTFQNILLPDSSTDQQNSQGAVKFVARHVMGLPDGTVINNNAAIYFDINAPVITNTSFVTLGNPIQTGRAPSVFGPEMGIKVWPNPATDQVHFQVEALQPGQVFRVDVYDLLGNKVWEQKGDGPRPTTLERSNLNNGIYVYQIKSQGLLLGAGKVILK